MARGDTIVVQGALQSGFSSKRRECGEEILRGLVAEKWRSTARRQTFPSIAGLMASLGRQGQTEGLCIRKLILSMHPVGVRSMGPDGDPAMTSVPDRSVVAY